MNQHQFATAVRDALLDAHEFASDFHRGVESVDREECRPGLEDRLQATVLYLTEQHALLTMRLAHLLDEFADQAAEAEDDESWKS